MHTSITSPSCTVISFILSPNWNLLTTGNFGSTCHTYVIFLGFLCCQLRTSRCPFRGSCHCFAHLRYTCSTPLLLVDIIANALTIWSNLLNWFKLLIFTWHSVAVYEAWIFICNCILGGSAATKIDTSEFLVWRQISVRFNYLRAHTHTHPVDWLWLFFFVFIEFSFCSIFHGAPKFFCIIKWKLW